MIVLTASDLMELQTRAHLQYVEFSRGLPWRRKQERKAMASMATAEAIADMMEDAPGLTQCTDKHVGERSNKERSVGQK